MPIVNNMDKGKPALKQEPARKESSAQRFGAYLKGLRDNYPDRIGAAQPKTALAYMKLTQAGFIKCLDEQHNVSISQGLYSEFESGDSLPRDPKPFLAAVKICLQLEPDDVDRLTNLLGFAITEQKLGLEVARRAFPLEDWPQK